MATPQNQNTGPGSIGGNVARNTTQLAGPALQLAQGASMGSVLGGASMDKLVGPTAALAGGLIGVLRTMNSIVRESGVLEDGMKRIANTQQIEGKFETLLKSAELAKQRIKELYEFTARSTFDFSDVAEGSRILEALTKGAMTGARGMKLVGDAAAATGQSFSETSEKVGKLYAALASGRSLDRVMMQLQMSGVVTDELAGKLENLEKTGASFNGMWTAVEDSLKRAEGGMANEIKTLSGLEAKLKTVSALMTKAFSEPFVAAQAASIEATTKATENLTPVLRQVGADMAPILTWFQSFKNSLVTNTLATKGFADGLLDIWSAAKTMFVVLAGGTGASIIKNFGGTVAELKNMQGAMGRAVTGFNALQTTAGTSAQALQLAADATKALNSGQLLLAANLKIQGLWLTVSTALLRAHAASMAAATAAGAGFNITAYAGALAAQGLSGAFRAFISLVAIAGRALAGLVLANPLIAAAAAATAAVMALRKHADAVKALGEEYYALSNALTATNAKLLEQRSNVKSLDEWRSHLVSVAEALAKVNGELNKPYEQGKQDQRDELKRRRGQLEGMLTATPGALGLSRAEEDAARRRVGEQSALSSQRAQDSIDSAQTGLGAADLPRQVELLRARAQKRARDAVRGQSVEDGINGFDRSEAGSTVAGNEAKIRAMGDPEANAAAQRAIIASSDSQIKNRDAAAGLSGNVSASDAVHLNRRNEAREQLAREESNITARDSMTAENRKLRLGSGSELLAINQQMADGGGSPDMVRRQQELLNLKDDAAGNEQGAAGDTATVRELLKTMTQFRRGAGIERGVNDRLAANNPSGARGITDNADRDAMRDKYKANGMSQAQADSDFAGGIKASAFGQAPRIVADSMQAVGGGGGFAAASPMEAAQKRMEAMAKTQTEYLKIISDSVGRKKAGVN